LFLIKHHVKVLTFDGIEHFWIQQKKCEWHVDIKKLYLQRYNLDSLIHHKQSRINTMKCIL